MAKLELAGVLQGSGALEALLRARSFSRPPWLTVLTYHRLHPDPKNQIFDPGVIDATPSEFEQQLTTLKRYFTVVGVEDVLRFMKGASLPPNPAVITFDDGYRECYDQALPILLKHGLKAAFFIATSYVTERRVFWWDRISYLLNQTTQPTIRLRYPKDMTLPLGAARSQAKEQLLRAAKQAYELDIERLLEELSEACDVRWGSAEEQRFADELVMTWDQIRALRAAGMEVHSHTRTHPILQNLPISALSRELVGARMDLEEQLNEPIRAISYPVGRSISQFPMLRYAVEQAGYEVGFSNGSGSTMTLGRQDPLDVRRISAEYQLPQAYFRAMLAIPIFH